MIHFSGQNLSINRIERPIFKDLSFSISNGDILVIRGSNGSGKSTLLRIMAGLITPTNGSIHWDGKSIFQQNEEHRERLHYVGHLNPIKPALTIHENIDFWTNLRTHPHKITLALNKFQITHLQHVLGRFLSAGQIRLANLARIISSPAILWLLDEPHTSLDEHATRTLNQIINNHRENGGIIVISTHSNIEFNDKIEVNIDNYTPSRAK